VTNPSSVPIVFPDNTSEAVAVPYSPPSPCNIKFVPSYLNVYTLFKTNLPDIKLLPLLSFIVFAPRPFIFKVDDPVLAACTLIETHTPAA